MSDVSLGEPFARFNVVHLVRPTGRSPRDLEDLRAAIADASPTTLFHHTFAPLLRFPNAAEPPPDDWSAWVNGVVQDHETAERLSFAVQARGGSADELRAGLLEVLDRMPEATRRRRDAQEEGCFVLLELESVRVPTDYVVGEGGDLMDALTEVPVSVLFFHLIEQPWLDPDAPSLVHWLRDHGERSLAARLAEFGRSGRSLGEERRNLARRWLRSRLPQRVADAATLSDDHRREEGRRAMARLARRLARPERSNDAGSAPN